MKRFKNLIVLVLITLSTQAWAQSTDKASVKEMVEAKDFIFTATSALPMNSSEINQILGKMSPGSAGLISLPANTYTIRIKPDSIEVYLPYYGRSYTASMNRDDNGFKFTSKEFSYESSARKKGGWDITIIPKDTKENPRLNLSIFKNGSGSLSISSSNKQSISYNGHLVKPKS